MPQFCEITNSYTALGWMTFLMKISFSSRVVYSVVLFLIAGCQGSDSPDVFVQPDLVLANVTVIDGLGNPPMPAQTVEIRGGRISAVRGSEPGDSGTIDASGLYLSPGLIDVHVHLPWEDKETLRLHLESLLSLGITSVRDMACCADVYFRLMGSPDSTYLPRILYSAFLADPVFFDTDPRVASHLRDARLPWSLAVRPATDLDSELDAAREIGVTGVKIYSNLPASRIEEIVVSAHRLGLRVWSHPVVFPTRPSDVISAGVDVVSHAALFVWEGAEKMPSTYNGGHPFNPFGPPAPYSTVAPDDPRVLAVLQKMRDRGTILDATLSTMESAVGREAALWAIELARLAHEMAIPIAAGTDRDNSAEELFEELEMLVDSVGLTPTEALSAATHIGATVLGLQEMLGSVEVGRVADLVVYESDPTQDIRNARRPSFVIKNGNIVRW